MYCLFFLNHRIGWAGGKDSNVLQTTDGGNKWKFVNEKVDPRGSMADFFDLHFINKNVGWGAYMRYGPLVKTTNGGKTWRKQELPGKSNPLHDSDLNGPRFFFVTPDEFWIAGLWLGLHTKDAGKTWQVVVQFQDNSGGVSDFYFLDADNGFMCASMNGVSGIYYTNDNGNRWNLCYEGNVGKLYFNSRSLGWGIESFLSGKYGLIRTDNGGKTWQKIESDVSSSKRFIDILFIDENEGWVVAIDEPEPKVEVLRTVDGGKTYETEYSCPMPVNAYFGSAKILCYDGENSVYAALGDKIVRYTDETYSERAMVLPWTISPKDEILTFWGKVKKDQLYQNYPNPFNPETWIPYRLANNSEAVIEIYDVTGLLVRKLNLLTKRSGVQTVNWDGTDSYGEKVSSGVYFYTIRAGGFTETKRMVLEK